MRSTTKKENNAEGGARRLWALGGARRTKSVLGSGGHQAERLSGGETGGLWLRPLFLLSCWATSSLTVLLSVLIWKTGESQPSSNQRCCEEPMGGGCIPLLLANACYTVSRVETATRF